MRMDKTDLLILQTLQTNGRITNSNLAKKVGLSAPSVLERVRKLEEAGIITGYHAKIEGSRVGRGQTCYVAISLSMHQKVEINEFHKRVNEIPEIIECFHITGEEDYLLKVMVRDMAHYEELLLNKLTKIPGTSKVKTMVVLSSIKTRSTIELDESELKPVEKARSRNNNNNSKN
jgi:Lrp/AsnC family leucine-responsive transcriptional regulator